MQQAYRSDRGDPPAPVIAIGGGGPTDDPQYFQTCEALLDSGADVTCIPSELIENLGLVVVDSGLVERGGMLGRQEENIFSAGIEVPVLGRQIVKVLETEDNFALLGRDILNRLIVLLGGPQGVLEIQQ